MAAKDFVAGFCEDINRITVEFKYRQPAQLPGSDNDINRITVEFKGKFIYRYINTNTILIESQWNLKKTHVIRLVAMHFDINRITVKFKG